MCFFFFFQAEDGIRDLTVTGVQTCALPISNDRAGELPAAAVRALLRSDGDVRLLVTHADRGFVEEVHFGSTPEEARRVWWDICWIWGPPEDHLATLLETVGIDRFVFGGRQPLR